ncbi:Uncharacterised protein [Bacteroides eggerthii]|uniref:Transmembrane protein n=1 Tax=Bacteroides eggerthii TaxID=28111 RepID=A0A380ZCJ3_9BACE|nr:hypothetical protein INE88_01098 [Bacteroides eggerthii]CCY55951.1 unknown [Bacteroides eggerthii CAG:109]SUV44230.1 Uncharacterised protein [Bacteroides eggerthii]
MQLSINLVISKVRFQFVLLSAYLIAVCRTQGLEKHDKVGKRIYLYSHLVKLSELFVYVFRPLLYPLPFLPIFYKFLFTLSYVIVKLTCQCVTAPLNF